MFKRIMFALTFAAALGAASLCLTDAADAQRLRLGRPYVSYYFGAPAYYGYVPNRTYYRGFYAPRVYSYSYAYPGYYYRPAPRVSVRVGPLWW
jgi:hypothetical protein